MKCEYCELKERQEEILYEDNEIVVAVKDMVTTPGQITVFPKEHFTILEMVPDQILGKCAAIANKVSIAAFECLGSQGTNIIVKNGLGADQTIPHFGIDIIPRQENDGLNLQWEPKQLMEDEIESVYSIIKEELEKEDQEPAEEKKETKSGNKETKEKSENKKNYLLKSLRRIP